MRYMATIYVSDVMDVVAATIELQAWSADYGPPELAGQWTMVLPGIGENDAREWLGRALFEASLHVTTPTSKG